MSQHSTANPTPLPALAYSYLRFSHPSQADGDSIRRQTELREGWLKRHPGVRLDLSLKLADEGVSGFRGKHRTDGKHALAEFLDLVNRGRIPRGSYLLIENMDRLSREKPVVAVNLLTGLLMAGVHIVQLSPDELELTEDSDLFSLFRGQMSQNTGHDESKKKSVRVGSAWDEKKTCVREGRAQPPRKKDGRVTKALTARLPAWLKEQGGEMAPIPERTAVVQRIFQLAANGYGIPSIVKRLTAEKVPAFGARERYVDKRGRERVRATPGQRLGSGEWTRSYVGLLLKDRRVLGEYQPRRGKEKEGDAVPGYYPIVITEAEWLAARAGASERRGWHGRSGTSQVNIFVRLLKHARDGDTYLMTQRFSKRPGRPTTKFQVLINSYADQGKARAYSIPYLAFERAILSCLRELDPHEILNGDQGPDETGSLSAQLTGVETELADATAFMDANGFSPAIGKRVQALEGQKRELAEQLAEARQKAAHPLSETWGETQSLVSVLEHAPDPVDIRLRLRSALRRMVSEIMLLIVPRGGSRLVTAQLWFAGGKKHRDYLFLHRPANKYRGAETSRPYSLATVAAPGDLDLRKRTDARKLESFLSSVDLTELE